MEATLMTSSTELTSRYAAVSRTMRRWPVMAGVNRASDAAQCGASLRCQGPVMADTKRASAAAACGFAASAGALRRIDTLRQMEASLGASSNALCSGAKGLWAGVDRADADDTLCPGAKSLR